MADRLTRSKSRDQTDSQTRSQPSGSDNDVMQLLRSVLSGQAEMLAGLAELKADRDSMASRMRATEDKTEEVQRELAALKKMVEDMRKEPARGGRGAPAAAERRGNDSGGGRTRVGDDVGSYRRSVFITGLPALQGGAEFEALKFAQFVVPDARSMDIAGARRLPAGPPRAGQPAVPPPLRVEFDTEAHAAKILRGWKALEAKPDDLAGVIVKPSLTRSERVGRQALAARANELWLLNCAPRWSDTDRTELT